MIDPFGAHLVERVDPGARGNVGNGPRDQEASETVAMTHDKTLGRRDVLRTLASAAGGAAIGAPSAARSADDRGTDDESRGTRYRESPHVKTFYRVNRYPRRGDGPC
jgi:hypothetical protein